MKLDDGSYSPDRVHTDWWTRSIINLLTTGSRAFTGTESHTEWVCNQDACVTVFHTFVILLRDFIHLLLTDLMIGDVVSQTCGWNDWKCHILLHQRIKHSKGMNKTNTRYWGEAVRKPLTPFTLTWASTYCIGDFSDHNAGIWLFFKSLTHPDKHILPTHTHTQRVCNKAYIVLSSSMRLCPSLLPACSHQTPVQKLGEEVSLFMFPAGSETDKAEVWNC